MRVVVLFFGITCGLGPVNAAAQTLGDAAGVVRPDDVVLITTVDGVTVKGQLVSISSTGIELLTPSAVVIQADRVSQLDKLGDSVGDGFKCGAIVGAIFGTVHAVAVFRKQDAILFVPKVATSTFEFGLLGALIDWLHKGRTTVYRASTNTRRVSLVTLNTQGRRGLALSIDWR